MNILGLNYFYHDSTACLVENGQLTIAIEEERLTRKKHTCGFPIDAIARCLSERELSCEDIDVIAVSVQPQLDWGKRAAFIAKNFPKSLPLLKYEVKLNLDHKSTFAKWLNENWPNKDSRPRIEYVPHHMSHAAGSFYVSPFESAAILSVDGSGEWASSLLGHGDGNTVTEYSRSYFPMSLGSVYESVTQFLGFRPCYDEGKTMGLAPLGDPEVFKDVVSEILTVDSDGCLHVDLSYFEYQYWGERLVSQKFYDTFGQARVNRADGKVPFEQHHYDVAAAFQYGLEECCLKMARILHDNSGEDNLVITGGVALNSVMNGRVVRETPFKDIYVMPAAGDNGTAMGAAYYVWNGLENKPRSFVHTDPYLGTEYSNDEIETLLKACKLDFEHHENIEEVTAGLLHEGQIVCWFQGRMEIGPRALGNRSILANPTLPHMKDKINAEVKHREAFRPFAPSCIVEAKDDYFDIEVEAPFMLKVCDVLEEKKEVVPAITHLDGTARLQTVDRETNPRYHKLISEFGKLSGVPVVLNTSFNIMGEPIVEAPVNAIRCFFSTGLDFLVMGNYLVSKRIATNDSPSAKAGIALSSGFPLGVDGLQGTPSPVN